MVEEAMVRHKPLSREEWEQGNPSGKEQDLVVALQQEAMQEAMVRRRLTLAKSALKQ